MALRITIDVFSGRPNPSVVVTGGAERTPLEQLGRPRLANDPRLGARGSAARRGEAGHVKIARRSERA